MKNVALKSLLFFMILLFGQISFAQCSPKEQRIYETYDAYLDANPRLSDSDARNSFAKKISMKPSALKDLYFRCLYETQLGSLVGKKTETKVGPESPLTAGISCNIVGYKYGLQAARSSRGLSHSSIGGITVPERCRGQRETDTGIALGTRDGMK